jgi:4-aminobutyrate aminotransferase-like enzyme
LPSDGEALHTSTYLGNPMGCAAALANIGEIERLALVELARSREETIGERLRAIARHNPLLVDVRGRGMLWALECADPSVAKACVVAALRAGVMLLQAGLRGECVTIVPPLSITNEQLRRALDILTSVTGERVLSA